MKKATSVALAILLVMTIGITVFPVMSVGPASGNDMPMNAATLSLHTLSLSLGQAYKLTASCNPMAGAYGVSWSSSDDSVASVTSYGLVVGKSAGTATITITALFNGSAPSGYILTDSCDVTVSSSQIIEDGTYFIQTAQTDNQGTCLNRYVSVEGESNSNGAEMEIDTLSGSHYKKWNFTLGSDGYYLIQSYTTQKYMRVTGSSSSAGATITQDGSVVTGSKWALMITSAGHYALVPASSTVSLVVLNVPSDISGYDLNTATYSANTAYYDEWILTRMLPLSGYELPYEPELWNLEALPIHPLNCYMYVLNVQDRPNTHDPFSAALKPGDFYNGFDQSLNHSPVSITGYENEPNNILSAVSDDVEAFRTFYTSNPSDYSFGSIGKYEACEEGSYKVALVIAQGSSDYPAVDFHWYRQDEDGLWSHKKGTYEPTRIDSNGKLIIDPETAARTYSGLSPADYNLFVGYYSLTPWNLMHPTNRGDLYSSWSELTEREKVLVLLESLGATIGTGKEVVTVYFDETIFLTFDCFNMSGYLTLGDTGFPVDSTFVLDTFYSGN